MADVHRPILTPKTVLPLFFVIGIVFAPIGGLLLYASSQVVPCLLRTRPGFGPELKETDACQ